MARNRMVAGKVADTADRVYELYRPSRQSVRPGDWELVRPLAVEACRRSGYVTPASALRAISNTAVFMGWAHREGLPLDLEVIFTPSLVERYCETQLARLSPITQTTVRSCLRTVGRGCTTSAPWPPMPRAFVGRAVVKPPYTSKEADGFWRAAELQTTARRIRVARTILALGLGAGAKPGEVLQVHARHLSRLHSDPRVLLVQFETRTVPVREPFRDVLLKLSAAAGDGPLIGPVPKKSKDPLGKLRESLVFPRWLPPFEPSRLRTTWMAAVLISDVRISEFAVLAGTKSAKTLEAVASHVPVRWPEDQYLIKAAQA